MKPCRTCKAVKPLDEFYLNQHGNPCGNCKVCYRADVNANRRLKKMAKRIAFVPGPAFHESEIPY